MGDVLVLAEHRGGHFPKTTLIGINAGLEMARKRNGNCIVVVMGDKVEGLAGELAKYGASKVIALEDSRLVNPLADAAAQALSSLAKKIDAQTILATATAMSKDLLPR